jgi:hypothetical protein
MIVASKENGERGSRGLSNVSTAVDSGVYLELSFGGGLDAIGHRLGDGFLVIPLRDSAACDTYGSSDGRPVPIEVRKHGRLKHAGQGTAC